MKMRKTICVLMALIAIQTGPALASAIAVPGHSVRPAGAVILSMASNVSGQYMSGMAAAVVSDVNAERAKYGLSPLRVDPVLTEAAAVRAGEIAVKFSHTRPDGSSWSTVSGSAYGENIARGHNSAYRVMAAWLTSSGHRKNILSERFGSIGVYALNVNGVIHWVQLFGK